jgi:hypothetical protein
MKAKTNKDVLRANQRGESGKKDIGDSQPPKKRRTFNKDIKTICPYSAKKNKAKVIAEYSTLNPETNSDSPSDKSKGALLVSAKEEIKNIIKAGNRGTTNQISF